MTTTTDTCAYDQAAQTSADYPFLRSQCRGCAIRSLAASPFFHAAGVSGRLNPEDSYTKALALIFGDGWRDGHQLVKAEFERNKKLRSTL